MMSSRCDLPLGSLGTKQEQELAKKSERSTVQRIFSLVAFFALLFTLWQPARANDTPKKESERELIDQLLLQIQELQARAKEIDELKARVAELEAKEKASSTPSPSTVLPSVTSGSVPDPAAVSVPAAPTSVISSTPAPATSAPASVAISSSIPSVPTPKIPTPTVPSSAAQVDSGSSRGVQLRVFGDAGYSATDQKGISNTFFIGSLDLFLTGNLSDRVSLLSEILFTPQPDNSISPDVERLLLQYKQNDMFAFAVGRYHTSIGYYNTAFHQGEWFQTAIGRPFMYAFDDQGGILPLQEVGLTTSGELPTGKLGLHYVAEIGNGRPYLSTSDPVQNLEDTNNGKAVNFALFARPSWLSGFEAGFSIHHDHLTFPNNINHPELISTVHAVYINSHWEFLNEAMLVRHEFTSTGAPGVFHTPAFYTQISHGFGKYRPYFRYSYFNAGVNEPVYSVYGDVTTGTLPGRRNGPALGVRFDFTDHAAFKLQYDRLDQRSINPVNSLTSQFSFAY